MEGNRSGGRGAVRSGLQTGISTAAVSGSAAVLGIILSRKFGHGVKTDGFFAAYGVYLALVLVASSLRVIVLPRFVTARADGRLGHANQAFAQLWNLSAAELATEPHFTNIAQRWTQKSGHDGIWDIVSAAIASEDPESYGDWGYLTRADGRELHLTPTRLPNGATLVTFRDLTDLMRFESLHLEAALDAA